ITITSTLFHYTTLFRSIDNNGKKEITLTSFYKNAKAKNNINVIIKQDKDIKILDILDMNKGINVTLGKKPIVISIVYRANFKTRDRKSTRLNSSHVSIS